MGRIRTIKPEFWRNEALSELPEFAHMLAAALLNYADDEGYFNANPRLIIAECFPLREPSMDTTVALRELSRIGYVTLGKGVDGRQYGRILAFNKHQTINKPVKSKIANISISWSDYSSTTVALPHGTGNGERGSRNGEVGTGNEENYGGGVARARESEPEKVEDVDQQSVDALITSIIHALGFDRGQSIPKYWVAPDAAMIVSRWRIDLGLTDDEIITVATRNSVQHGEPANGPKTLNRAMQDFAAAKAAAPLTPSASAQAGFQQPYQHFDPLEALRRMRAEEAAKQESQGQEAAE